MAFRMPRSTCSAQRIRVEWGWEVTDTVGKEVRMQGGRGNHKASGISQLLQLWNKQQGKNFAFFPQSFTLILARAGQSHPQPPFR